MAEHKHIAIFSWSADEDDDDNDDAVTDSNYYIFFSYRTNEQLIAYTSIIHTILWVYVAHTDFPHIYVYITLFNPKIL